MSASVLRFDYEAFSEADLPTEGLDRYSRHPSTYIQMNAWQLDDCRLRQWQIGDGPMPREFVDAVSDPHVIKIAFNAQYERVTTKNVLRIPTPYKNWRCTMVRAFSQSFTGGLGQVAEQLDLPPEFRKDKEGERLMKMFMRPQRVTKNQPHLIRNADTDPEDWEKYLAYNRQDVIAEAAMERRLAPYPMLDSEWELYEIDQQINDCGMPVDMLFVRHALEMADRRQKELQDQIQTITGAANPNSVSQLLPWLRERGYWFEDLRADTIVKVLNSPSKAKLDSQAVEVLKLRQWAARSSTDKYEKLLAWVGEGDRARFMFQFGGASRTNRWAGRGPQPQNLNRGSKRVEDSIEHIIEVVRANDEPALRAWVTVKQDEENRKAEKEGREPQTVDLLEPLVGSVRSSFQAPDGHEFVVCDLSAIESRVIGWMTGCKRLNGVFALGLDPYKDFGTELYNKAYEMITKKERGDSKPGMLGCGFRLSGGELRDGKRTGLWGYAENMGVDLTKEDAHRQVAVFREKYPEIPQFWYTLEKATIACVQTGRPQQTGPVRWEMMSPYLVAVLPSGRRMYYQHPRVESFEAISKAGNPYIRKQLSYMAKNQVTHKWQRQETHGGVWVENITQSIARDILKVGMIRAHDEGFQLAGSVHDELIAVQKIGENRLTADLLACCMRFPIHWAPGLLLDAAGWQGRVYKKD